MKEAKNRSQLIYGIVSVTSPLAIVGSVIIYQSIVRAKVGHVEHLAAALMDFGNAMQLFSFILISCLVGLAFACTSLLIKPKTLVGSIAGYLGLIINGLPLLYLTSALLTGR